MLFALSFILFSIVFMFCLIATDLVDSKPIASMNDTLSAQLPFETYDVENTSSAENVTLEFIDLPTTEDFSSTTSISQYLETANYREGIHIFFYSFPFVRLLRYKCVATVVALLQFKCIDLVYLSERVGVCARNIYRII